MGRTYRCVSADSHLEIGPDPWRERVPKQYRDRAPRRIRLASGADAFLVENRPILPLWLHNAGAAPETWGHNVPWRYEDNMPGCGPPEQRVREIDQDGVDAEILFMSIKEHELWKGIADDDVYGAVLRAYNDYVGEDYRAVAPDRLFPVGLVPDRGGVERAVAEMAHCKRLGLKAVTLFGFPGGGTTPGPADDRFWAAAIDLEMAVTVHRAGSFRQGGGRNAPSAVHFPGMGGALDLGGFIAQYGFAAGRVAAQLAVHGVFQRFPKLQVYFAETQIGWIPNFLEQADMVWERHRFYHEREQGLAPIPRKPSEYIREHCHWGFIDNPIGVQLRKHIGVDKIMWSTDFPHDPSDWPHSKKTIERNFVDVPEDEKRQIVAGNAVQFFRLDA
jgi:predicted TIM-barrel fold metal-dependent hydrolase